MVESVQEGLMRDAEKFFFLTQTDNTWREHLQAIKFLQNAVGLRGYAQRDPLTEFKLEAYNLFLDMQSRKRRNTIYNVYAFVPTKVGNKENEQVKNGDVKNKKSKKKSKKEKSSNIVEN